MYYNCLCDCGKLSTVSYFNLITGASRKCGNCRDKYIRGSKVSFKQLDLRKILDLGIVNFRSGRYSIDIALHINQRKIAIEYDEIYWHKDNEDRDLKKNKFLIEKNWKVLRIKASNNLPSQDQIFDVLAKMIIENISFYELDIT